MNFQAEIREYPAEIVDIHDGDTITAKLDCGFGIWKKDKFRLLGIQAPEVTGESKIRGMAAKHHLLDLIGKKPVFIQTVKDRQEKFGRYLATVIVIEGGMVAVNVNDRMVQDGHAVKWDGKGPRPE